jgi:hypothetical protein
MQPLPSTLNLRREMESEKWGRLRGFVLTSQLFFMAFPIMSSINNLNVGFLPSHLLYFALSTSILKALHS